MTEALRKSGSRPAAIPITARQALEWGTINGARMVGLDHRIGSLAPGKQADILMLRASDPNMHPVHDPVASAVMQGGVANVDTVLIAGRIVKRGGKLADAQLPERQRRLAGSGRRILEDFERLPRKAS
jgi:5-methylthioadenosine/S-adenosylhomocysteine deaminase